MVYRIDHIRKERKKVRSRPMQCNPTHRPPAARNPARPACSTVACSVGEEQNRAAADPSCDAVLGATLMHRHWHRHKHTRGPPRTRTHHARTYMH
jgi:hypothetical protein